MKQKVINVIIIFIIIIMLYFVLTPIIFLEIWNVQSGHPPTIVSIYKEFADSIDTGISYKKYNEHLDEYIIERFGDIVSNKFIILENGGSYYKIKFNDIMEKSFSVGYNKISKKCTDTFSSTLTTDPKFQHLYSEWIKKEMGIDDENVELKFSEGMYRGRMVGERPYVDFKSITSIDNLEEQICEHIHNLYIREIYINNYEFDAKENILNYANLIEEKIKKFVFVYNENISYIDSQIYKNQIYNFMFNNLIIYVNLFNNKDYYKIVYDYNYNTREYRKFYYDGSISTQWEKF